MNRPVRFWLMKSEPDVYSIDDLARDGVEPWNGVRNYQARNYLRDAMEVGDLALFYLYHSNARPPGVAGVMRVASGPEPDLSALDAGGDDHDPRATEENPIWVMRRMAFVEKFPRLVSLEELRADPWLEGLALLKRGQRLSIMPVDVKHFWRILELARD